MTRATALTLRNHKFPELSVQVILPNSQTFMYIDRIEEMFFFQIFHITNLQDNEGGGTFRHFFQIDCDPNCT